jgi:uncharacterized protein (DUF736 family)
MNMSKIGYLKPVTQGMRKELHGEINTLQIQLKIKLIPNSNRKSDRAPDYLISAIGITGQETEIGSAWKKAKAQIGDIDFEYLSITIDDPAYPLR